MKLNLDPKQGLVEMRESTPGTPSKRIIENRPNAESLSSQHSRKSSAVVKEMMASRSSQRLK